MKNSRSPKSVISQNYHISPQKSPFKAQGGSLFALSNFNFPNYQDVNFWLNRQFLGHFFAFKCDVIAYSLKLLTLTPLLQVRATYVCCRLQRKRCNLIKWDFSDIFEWNSNYIAQIWLLDDFYIYRYNNKATIYWLIKY